jgi:phage terminase large subunit
MAFQFLDAYAPLFNDKTYYVIYGGRGGGKTRNVAGYLLLKLLSGEYFRGVIARYAATSTKGSIYSEIEDLIKSMELTNIVITGSTIENTDNGNKIITHAFKMAEGTMTAKSKGLANVTHLLIDEAEEVKSELDYIKLIDSFRTPGVEKKIFILFNPPTKAHWIHRRWFIDGKPNPKWLETHAFIQTTYRDNPFFDPRTAKEWDDREKLDYNNWYFELMGNWKEQAEGKIYTDWEWVTEKPARFKQYVYGLDFGFNHPTVLTKCWFTETEIYIENLIYERGLTSTQLIERMRDLGIDVNTELMCDYARPEIISEINSAGYYALNAMKAVKLGIDTVKSFRIFAPATDLDLKIEYENYAWKSIHGQSIDEPVKQFDDAMDAIRYAVMQIKTKYVDYQPLISF